MSLRVLSIDLSTNAGVAVVDASGVRYAGVVNAPKLGGMPRINSIVSDILALRDKWTPDKIFIEDFALGINMGAVIVQVQIATVLHFVLWQEGTPYSLVHPTTLKRFLVGKGTAKKELMMMEVYKRWGHSSEGNDEADAVALGFFGLAAHGCAVNCTKSMSDVASEWMSNPPVAKKPKKKHS